ncbi:hypothetical protein ASG19_04565 [Rhizobium sp. Leaf306]|uniref:hypothetical protein n=1 Tax=Rhizobium sp. Leaf306 TaxID=1736330 RepID=UPI000715A03A|nr:hypothetical protein [Rhizobium sp. Leaf306]KQQ38331.1 hypothetical protein ASG19_04565 [Rhizobium sp. Leaf306]
MTVRKHIEEVEQETVQKRRRTCADRLRHNLAERQRRRRGDDPAGKVFLQLLGLLSGALALLPPLPDFYVTCGSRHSAAGRVASREALPRSDQRASLDRHDAEDRGPTAYAMERGIEPVFYRLSSRAAPSWSKLVKDLKRRQTSERARLLLEYRVPPEAVEWLRHVISLECWSALLQLGRDGADDDAIAAAALAEARRWKATLVQMQSDPAPAADDAGNAAPPAGPKPK